MSFFLPRHFIAFLFVLVPLLLHILRKSSVKKLHISSLYLFQRREKKFFRHLKLSYLLLLISRIAIVAALAFFFIQPVYENAAHFLQKIFPYKGKIIVFLDTALDTRETLTDFFENFNPGQKQQVIYKIINTEEKVMDSIEAQAGSLNDETRFFLISRFYGFQAPDLQRLEELKINPIPFGPDTMEKIHLSNLRTEPDNPFLGEKTHVSGQLLSGFKENRKVSVNLKTDQGYFDEQIIELEAMKSSGFSFAIPTDKPGVNNGTIEIEDEQYDFSFQTRNEMRIAFVDDELSSTQSGSRLFYLRNFFQGLAELFAEGSVFILRDFKTADFIANQDNWDWIIFATVSSTMKGLKRKDREKYLVFRPKNEKNQLFWDEFFEMQHFITEQRTINVEFSPAQGNNISQLFKNWQVFRHLQIKPPQSADIYLSANAESLCFAHNKDIFSAFDWTKEEFSAVLDPSFPLFLTEIFLNRTVLPKNNLIENEQLSRNPDLFNKELRHNTKTIADFSPAFLWLVLFFICAELFLILKIEKITE